MKKLLASLLTLTIILCAFSTVSFAADETNAVFKVEYADGSATVYCADTTELNAAIKTTTDTFITMLKDYTETTIRMTFPENENDVVLDLGGHTWTYEKEKSNPAVAIYGKNVTIKNGTISYVNTVTSGTSARPIIHLYTDGTVLNLEKTTLTRECRNSNEKIRGIWAGAKAVAVTVNMTDVNIYASECIILGSGDTFNIYGGNYISTDAEMIISNSNNFQYTTVNLYGGTFSNSWSDIVFKSTTEINIPDEYEEIANTDGTYSIVRKPVTVSENITETYADGKGTKTARFFADIADIENVAEAGFKVSTTFGGVKYTWKIALNEVYNQVIANDVTYNATNYILTGAIGDVPNDFEGDFEVEVYTVDFEGNEQ